MKIGREFTQPFEYLIPIGFCISGSLFAFLKVLESGSKYIPGDLIDSRLVNLLMEHGYLYFFSDQNESLWNPFWIFYPAENSLTLTESMIGALPVYILFRLTGLDAPEAYQGWFVVSGILNFFFCYLFLRIIKLQNFAASAGAFLFAFSMPVTSLMNHPQLLQRFFIPLSSVFLYLYFISNKKKKRILSLYLFFIFSAFQFWTGNYTGWFYFYILLLVFLIALFFKNTRNILIQSLNRDRIHFFSGVLLAFLTALPLILRLAAHQSERSWEETLSYAPDVYYLLKPHPGSFLYRNLNLFSLYLKTGMSTVLFSGLISLTVPLIIIFKSVFLRFTGKLSNSEFDFFQLFLLILSILVVSVFFSFLRFGDFSLWYFVYHTLPGADAIRAVSRIIAVLIFPSAILTAALVDRIRAIPAAGIYLSWLLSFMVVIENSHFYNYTYSKNDHRFLVAEIENRLTNSGCSVFHYRNPKYVSLFSDVDAMWASLRTGIPTVNGYSGGIPPGWKLNDRSIVEKKDIKEWLAKNQVVVPDKKICIFSE